MKKYNFHLIVAFIFCLSDAFGQDLHYSQFYNSPLNLNPAQTGIFNGDKRFNLSFRDQWRFVPVAWTTFSLAYDFKKYLADDKHFLGLGGNLNYDRQGDSKLTLTGLNLAGSYTRSLNSSNLLSGGLMLGVNGRGYNTTNLTWDKQWNGVAFNSGINSGEKFDVRRVILFELASGLNYRYQRSERTKVDIGIGAYHLHQPTTTFYNSPNEELPLHMTYSLIGSMELMKNLDIQINGLHQAQEEYKETIIGGLAKLYINQKRGKETQVHVGLGYRTAGSIIPTFAVQFNEWYGSFSYDLDNNNFNDISSSNRGGPEFHLRYIIKNVRPLSTRKNCPIY
jgi:type IX secretion system PorP/SprF family membrane protein